MIPPTQLRPREMTSRDTSTTSGRRTTLAFAHDYLTQKGGAERVALALASLAPSAPLFTALYDANGTFPGFGAVDVRTSPLQHVPSFRRDPRLAFPLLAKTWEHTKVDARVVIVSSSGWAHAISAPRDAIKVVYCHNPARWLHQRSDYFKFPATSRLLHPALNRLSTWDHTHAQAASLYIANSRAVAERIERAYGRCAPVVHPPITLNADGPQDPMPKLEPGYWLAVSRGRGYKNIDLLVDAFHDLPGERLVIVGSRSKGRSHSPNVTWTGDVTDPQLRWLYANARALTSVSFEDFGLTPLEANQFGTPALLLRAGGFLDSLDEGVNGAWIQTPEIRAIWDAVKNFPEFDTAAVKGHAQKFSLAAFKHNLSQAIEAIHPDFTWDDDPSAQAVPTVASTNRSPGPAKRK